jgi:hypothetical protein
MSRGELHHVAQAREQAQKAVAAARAARERSTLIRMEKELRQRRSEPGQIDPDTEAALGESFENPPSP